MAESAKILVIDDSEDDRFLYRRALKSANADYDIVEKEDGEDCLGFIAEENPACILLDYSLPGRNGIEVLKRIRSKYPYMPVLILTGQGNEALAVNAIREGAQHYLSKASITPDSLQRSIRVAIEYCTMQRRIQEQRDALELFTRALAHDLKEPVRTIRSFLDIISRPGLPQDKADKYFTYIRRAAERMGGLIDSVYFYMRLDRGAGQPACEACDSAEALAGAQENLDMLIKEKNATITTGELPQVFANQQQLLQVLQNLIGNALRYCDERPDIRVTAERQGDHWLFRVTDNGIGVAPGQAEEIFMPFRRLTQRNSEGLGLGLSICKKIILSQGGEIWCEPVTPHGTRMCFTVGAVDAASNGELHAPQTVMENKGECLANIMIVEDNEADIELIRFALLEEEGLRCNLHVSNNGREALMRLQDPAFSPEKVGLMLLDINMPGMDGFELLAALRQAGLQHVPVVMCSTSSYDKDIERARALNATGFIVKPFDFNKLKPLLEKMPHLHLRREKDGSVLTCDAA